MQDHALRTACQEKLFGWMHAATRSVLKDLLETVMEHRRDQLIGCAAHQRSSARRGLRNGYYERWLDTTRGPVRLRVPRVRDCREPLDVLVLEHYGRRRPEIDGAIRDWVACGHSTRQVSRTLEDVFGCLISAGGVSRIIARLDRQIAAFHSRPLDHGYRYVFFDAKHWHTSHLRRRRRGRGKKKKAALLLAWGVRHGGAEELIDFRAVDSESGASWGALLTDLEERGLRRRNRWGQTLDMIVTDGDAGLLEGLWTVYPTVPKQRCVFHKVQSLADHIADRSHRKALLASAGEIYEDLETPRQARRRLKAWQERWQDREPEAVRAFTFEFEDTLTYLNAPPADRRRVKTTNPIERFIKELNRKIIQIGVFPSAKSWERCTWLTWQRLQTDRYGRTKPSPSQTPSTQDS